MHQPALSLRLELQQLRPIYQIRIVHPHNSRKSTKYGVFKWYPATADRGIRIGKLCDSYIAAEAECQKLERQ